MLCDEENLVPRDKCVVNRIPEIPCLQHGVTTSVNIHMLEWFDIHRLVGEQYVCKNQTHGTQTKCNRATMNKKFQKKESCVSTFEVREIDEEANTVIIPKKARKKKRRPNLEVLHFHHKFYFYFIDNDCNKDNSTIITSTQDMNESKKDKMFRLADVIDISWQKEKEPNDHQNDTDFLPQTINSTTDFPVSKYINTTSKFQKLFLKLNDTLDANEEYDEYEVQTSLLFQNIESVLQEKSEAQPFKFDEPIFSNNSTRDSDTNSDRSVEMCRLCDSNSCNETGDNGDGSIVSSSSSAIYELFETRDNGDNSIVSSSSSAIDELFETRDNGDNSIISSPSSAIYELFETGDNGDNSIISSPSSAIYELFETGDNSDNSIVSLSSSAIYELFETRDNGDNSIVSSPSSVIYELFETGENGNNSILSSSSGTIYELFEDLSFLTDEDSLDGINSKDNGDGIAKDENSANLFGEKLFFEDMSILTEDILKGSRRGNNTHVMVCSLSQEELFLDGISEEEKYSVKDFILTEEKNVYNKCKSHIPLDFSNGLHNEEGFSPEDELRFDKCKNHIPLDFSNGLHYEEGFFPKDELRFDKCKNHIPLDLSNGLHPEEGFSPKYELRLVWA